MLMWPLLSHQSLQDLLASEGQLVVLECRVKGVPSPRVDWYREGKIIEDSPDFRILQKSKLCCHLSAVKYENKRYVFLREWCPYF